MGQTRTTPSVVQEYGNEDLWKCTCGNNTYMDGFTPCDEKGDFMQPEIGKWKDLYTCEGCGHVFNMSTVKEQTKFDLSTMNRKERYELAAAIISQISNEWTDADGTQKWEEENVEEYECNMSFDELAAEVRTVSFKELPSQK